jgi:hypothetical protein
MSRDAIDLGTCRARGGDRDREVVVRCVLPLTVPVELGPAAIEAARAAQCASPWRSRHASVFPPGT